MDYAQEAEGSLPESSFTAILGLRARSREGSASNAIAYCQPAPTIDWISAVFRGFFVTETVYQQACKETGLPYAAYYHAAACGVDSNLGGAELVPSRAVWPVSSEPGTQGVLSRKSTLARVAYVACLWVLPFVQAPCVTFAPQTRHPHIDYQTTCRPAL